MLKSRIFKRRHIVLVVAITFFLILTLMQLHRPLVTDELIYPQLALSLKEEGRPLTRNTLYKRDPHLLDVHPPLFPYSIAFMYALGLDPESVRLVPLIFALGTIFLIYKIGTKLTPEKEWVPILAVLIYTVNPLSVQSALLVDIDNSIMTFLITLFVYIFLRSEKSGKSEPVVLAIVLGLALFSKVVTPNLLILPIIIYIGLIGGIKKGVVRGIQLLSIAWIAFLILWIPYTMSTGASILGPFTYLFMFGSYVGGFGFIKTLLVGILYSGLKIHIFWLTPAYFILVISAVGHRFRRLLEHQTPEKIDFIALYSTAIFFFYVLLALGAPWKFPRYAAPALPGFALLVAFYLYHSLRDVAPPIGKRILPYIAAISIAPIFHALFFKDPLIPPKTALETAEISFLYTLPLFLALSILYVFMRGKLQLKTIALLGITIAFFSTASYIDYVQLNADYSTINNYGEKGFIETAEYVSSHTSKQDVIVAPDDIAYFVKRDYFEVEQEIDSMECESALLMKRIKYVVLRGDWDMRYHPLLFECLKKNYKEVNFGNFYIYEIEED